MHQLLLDKLRPISEEEKRILKEKEICRDIYTTG